MSRGHVQVPAGALEGGLELKMWNDNEDIFLPLPHYLVHVGLTPLTVAGFKAMHVSPSASDPVALAPLFLGKGNTTDEAIV